ncbi:MAG TPA: methyltransferase domain-containing protein [Flavihumibacter sp.]|jgi:predicted nicotinamide N-methyase
MSTIQYELATYTFGEQRRLVQVPNEEQIKAWYQQARWEANPPDFPFWARVWPSAIQMTWFLHQHPSLYTGKRVLEIAAGLGLPSLYAADQAAAVLATDYSPEAVECMQHSIIANGWTNMKAEIYNWHDGLPQQQADLLLLSDTNYAEKDLQAVEAIIHHYLQQETTVMITTPTRVVARQMLQDLQPFCYHRSESKTGDGLVTYLLSKNIIG